MSCKNGKCCIKITQQEAFYIECKKKNIQYEEAKKLYAKEILNLLQNDKKASIKLIKQYTGLINFINPVYLNDFKYMKALLKSEAWTLLHVLPKERLTKQVLLTASNELNHFPHLLDEHFDDFEFCVKLVKANHFLLQHMPNKLKNQIKFTIDKEKYGEFTITESGIKCKKSKALLLIKDNIDEFKALSEELRADEEIASFVLHQKDGFLVYKYVPEKLKNDKVFTIEAIKVGVCLGDIPRKLGKDIDVISVALAVNTYNLNYLLMDAPVNKLLNNLFIDILNDITYKITLDEDK